MKNNYPEPEDLDWEDLEEDAMRDDKLPIPENFLQDACWSELRDREIDDDIYD